MSQRIVAIAGCVVLPAVAADVGAHGLDVVVEPERLERALACSDASPVTKRANSTVQSWASCLELEEILKPSGIARRMTRSMLAIDSMVPAVRSFPSEEAQFAGGGAFWLPILSLVRYLVNFLSGICPRAHHHNTV